MSLSSDLNERRWVMVKAMFHYARHTVVALSSAMFASQT
jgi:hypothetical protein